jgi:hypothetical protein
VSRLLAAVCAALTIAALVAACGNASGHNVHGRVTDRDYEPARSTWTWQPTTRQKCTTTTRRYGNKTSSSRSCRTVRTGRHRIVHHTPACWLLQLDTGPTLCVSAGKWHRTHVGDRV